MEREGHRDTHGAGASASETTDPLRELLAIAGPRPAAPVEMTARIREATHGAWQDEMRLRRERQRLRQRRVWAGLAAVAATLVVGIGLWWQVSPAPPSAVTPAEIVATLERAIGPIDLQTPEQTAEQRGVRTGVPADGRAGPQGVVGDAGAPTSLAEGGAIRAGATVRTRPTSRAALRLRNGVSLRLDAGTVVRFERAGELVLEAGALYADTGDEAPRPPAGAGGVTGGDRSLRVRTPYGIARDIGTRFEVRLLDRAVRVRVRDGLVQLEQGARAHTAEQGVELVGDAGGQVSRRPVKVTGVAWDWIAQAAPAVTIDGETLATFLAWVEREGGWSVQFDDERLAQTAKTTIVHGSVEGLTPEESLTAVLATCGLRHELREDGRVLVSSAASAPSSPGPASPRGER